MRLILSLAASLSVWACLVAPAAVVTLGGGTAVLAAGGPTRVGVIDLNKVLDLLDEKVERERQLEGFLKGLEDGVNTLAKQLKQARDELDILPKNGAAFVAKREEVLKLTARVQGEAQAAKILAEDKKKTMQIDLYEKIADSTRDFARRNGYDLILVDDSKEKIPADASPQQAQAAMINRRILFAGADIDVSEQVAQQMNNEFKATGSGSEGNKSEKKPN